VVHPPRDQRGCGSCWALHAVDILAERIAIRTGGRLMANLSAQAIVSCDGKSYGCGGGKLSRAWEWLKETGAVPESCFPYESKGDYSPPCQSTCTSRSGTFPLPRFKVQDHYRVGGSIVHGLLGIRTLQIQEEIMNNGPVEAGLFSRDDLKYYQSGIYTATFGKRNSGHAVKLIGWGTENGVAYWIAQNSWGAKWGEGGYFRIRRGVDECGVETHVYAGTPETYTEEQLRELESVAF